MPKTLSLPRFFIRMVHQTPWAYLASILGGILVFGARFLPPLILRRFYDDLTGAAPAALTPLGLLGLYVGIEAARLLANFSVGFPLATFYESGRMRLTQNTLRLILKQPGAQPLSVPPGDAVNRLDDDVGELSHFPLWLSEVTGHAVFSIAAFFVMLRINAVITLVVVLPLFVVIILTNAARDRLLRYYAARRTADGEVSAFLGELFGAVQAVKIAGAEASVVTRFEQLNERRRHASLRHKLMEETLEWLSTNISDLAVGGVLLLSGSAIRDGSFTIGDFSLFVSYLWFIVRFPAVFGGFLADYRTQEVSMDRLLELVEEKEPAVLARPTPIYRRGPLPAIHRVPATADDHLQSLRVSGLTFHFAGESRGIEAVDLVIEPGTLTIVTGQVGSGKTTLLRVLMGLLPKDDGNVFWNEQLVVDPARFMVPPRCAYLSQIPRLFSHPLRDNILLGLSPEEVDLDAAIQAAVLEDDIPQLKQGLDTIVGPRGVKLSGGQIQRTAAARLFLRQPALMVFDDLSSALDVETEVQLWQRLLSPESSLSRPTILAVSHRRPILQQADQIIVMRAGRVENAGTLSQLLLVSAEMQRIWVDQ